MLRDFDFRSNSIGFLRFFFASVVIWSHAYPLGGFGGDPVFRFSRGNEIAGNLAVAGFFVLSGFLIMRSYGTTQNIGQFLWHRFLRIFPAYWICLIVVAFGFAALAYSHENGTLVGFLTSPNPPWGFATNNLLLRINQDTIGGLLAHTPYPLKFNAPLWTLQWEFFCYITIGILGFVGILKSRPIVLLTPLIALFLLYALPLSLHGVGSEPTAFRVIELFVYFLIGAAAFLYRSHIPMRGWAAFVCAIAIVLALPTRACALVLPPCMAYTILFVAMKWPIRSFDRRVDLSYGIYIYAFPTQQLLALYGFYTFGFAPYFLVAIIITAAFASASWFLIERPSLSLKHLFSGAHPVRRQPQPAP